MFGKAKRGCRRNSHPVRAIMFEIGVIPRLQDSNRCWEEAKRGLDAFPNFVEVNLCWES